MSTYDEDPRPEGPDPLLDGQAAEVSPPAGLRREVVARLRREGLVVAGAPWLRWTVTAAALAVAFVGGRASVPPVDWTAGPPEARSPAAGALAAGPRQWALLLYEDARFDAGDATADELVGVYARWAEAERERGGLILAEKLADTETLLAGGEATTRAVGPAAGAGALTGLFIVEAPDRAAALDVARRTPHHRFGGVVLVRAIDPT
jgi:hypothetical protein